MTKDEQAFLILHYLLHAVLDIAFVDAETLYKLQELIHKNCDDQPEIRRALIELTQTAFDYQER